MGRAARPLHDAGNHRSIERGSDLQAARRSSLSRRPNLPESIKIDAALTPQLGARSRIIAKICPIVSQMRSWTADIRAGFLRELSGCSHIAAGRRDARSAYFLLYQREGAIGRARRDGTIAFHCGILVHFWCIFCGGSTPDNQARQASITNIPLTIEPQPV